MKELVLGAGYHRLKRIFNSLDDKEFKDPVYVDINPDTKPDICLDMNLVRVSNLPFEDNEFDEIHAYDCLEHWGSQGDYKFFFKEFNEYYRVLKLGGLMFIFVPLWCGQTAFCDPGHVRIFHPLVFEYLNTDFYIQLNDGSGSPASDYRNLLKCNFKRVKHEDLIESSVTQIILQKHVMGN